MFCDWLAAQMVVVGGDLDREGYLHLRDVIDPSLVTPELIEHISSTPPNPADGYSGILRPQHTPATVEIERQTIEAILKAHPGLDAVTQPRTQDPVQLVPGRPLIAIKVGPNADKKKTGGLNWHVDAYSYFLRGDHHQWYVAYTPILKENERDSNLAVIPYSVLQKVDPRAYEKLKGRGAVDFIKMQKGWRPSPLPSSSPSSLRLSCRTLKKWYGLRPPRSCAAAARTGPGSGRSQPEAREARRASKKRRDIAEFSGSATTQR